MDSFCYYLFLHLDLGYRAVENSWKDATFTVVFGKDQKGKASWVVYLVAVPPSFVNQWITFGLVYANRSIFFGSSYRKDLRLISFVNKLSDVCGGWFQILSIKNGEECFVVG